VHPQRKSSQKNLHKQCKPYTLPISHIEYWADCWESCINSANHGGSFPQKSPIISGSFAKNDLQIEASYTCAPPCNELSWPLRILHQQRKSSHPIRLHQQVKILKSSHFQKNSSKVTCAPPFTKFLYKLTVELAFEHFGVSGCGTQNPPPSTSRWKFSTNFSKVIQSIFKVIHVRIHSQEFSEISSAVILCSKLSCKLSSSVSPLLILQLNLLHNITAELISENFRVPQPTTYISEFILKKVSEVICERVWERGCKSVCVSPLLNLLHKVSVCVSRRYSIYRSIYYTKSISKVKYVRIHCYYSIYYTKSLLSWFRRIFVYLSHPHPPMVGTLRRCNWLCHKQTLKTRHWRAV